MSAKKRTVLKNSDALMAQLEAIAREHGGSLAQGQTFKNSTVPMKFIDKSGNAFELSLAQVKYRKQWSPYESRQVS